MDTVELWLPTATRAHVALDARLAPFAETVLNIQTHMSVAERLRLADTALGLPNGFVACEIGSYLGASTYLIGLAARLNGGVVHAVDTWGNDAMGIEGQYDTFAAFSRHTAEVSAEIRTVRGWSTEVADQVPDGLDLLFVDGDHSAEGVHRDLVTYVPKLKPGGLLLMHDYHFESVSQAAEPLMVRVAAESLGRIDSLQSFRCRDPSALVAAH